MAFGILLWKSVILTSVTLLLRDIAGIGSAPRIEIVHTLRKGQLTTKDISVQSLADTFYSLAA